ncbi:MAG: O-antigen ligase family protein [Planctomycetota bacterium]
MSPVPTIVRVIRGGLSLLLLLPLVYAGWPSQLAGLLPEIYFPAVTARNLLFRAVLAVVVPCWAWLCWREPRYRPRWSGALAALVALVVAQALANALGADPERSLWSNFERMEGWVGLLFLLAFYLVASTVCDRRCWRRAAVGSLAVATVVGICVLGQWLDYVHGFDLPDWLGRVHDERQTTRYFRTDACFGNPVFIASYMLIHVFVAAWLGLRAPRRWMRVAALGLGLLYAFAIYLTQTRIAFLAIGWGAVVGVAVALSHGQRIGRHAALVVGGSLAVAALGALWLFLAPPAWLESLPGIQRLRFLPQAIERRWLYWEGAWNGILERPFLGWGQENFGLVYDANYDPRLYPEAAWFDHPHNVFLGWFVAGGVLGGFAYLALFGVTLHYAWSRRTPGLTATDRGVLLGLLAAHGAFLAVQLDHLISYLALLAVVAMLDQARGGPEPRGAARSRLWLAAGCGATALGVAVLVGHVAPVWRRAAAVLEVAVASARVQAVAAGVAPPDAAADRRMRQAAQLAVARPGLGRTEAREELVSLAQALLKAKRGVDPAVCQQVIDLALREALAEAEIRSHSARPRVVAAHLLLSLGRAADAEPLLEGALERAPGKPVLLHALANVYLATGRGDRAMQVLRELHERQPLDRATTLVGALVAMRVRDEPAVEEFMTKLYPEVGPGVRRRPPEEKLEQALMSTGHEDWLLRIYGWLAEEAERLLAAGVIEPEEAFLRWERLAGARHFVGDRPGAEAALRAGTKVTPQFTERAQSLMLRLRLPPRSRGVRPPVRQGGR